MARSGSYDIKDFALRPDDEAKRLEAQVDLFWPQESDALAEAGLSGAKRLADFGCATGHYMSLLRDRFPGLAVHGVEIDSGLAGSARQRIEDEALEGCAVTQASVYETGLEGGQFDAVVMRLVLEHLEEPDRALAEAWRVLRPGGRLILIDNDFAFHERTAPDIPQLDTLYEAYCRARRDDGGNPNVGRELPGLLLRSGFSLERFQLISAHSSQTGDQAFLEAEGSGIPAQLVERGYLDKQVLDGLTLQWLSMLGKPGHAIFRQLFLAVGEKSEAPGQQPTAATESFGGRQMEPVLLPLSADSDEELRRSATAFAERLEAAAGRGRPLGEIAAEAASEANRGPRRVAVVASDPIAMAADLRAFAEGTRPPSVSCSPDAAQQEGKTARLAFVFSGQGGQRVGMGSELFGRQPVFCRAVEECDALFRQVQRDLGDPPWSLVEEMLAPEPRSRLDRTDVAQPLLFALQVGLVALWRSWGVTPDAVLGHSVGEACAAYVAGVLSLEDAIRVVYHRSRLQHCMAGHGGMAAAGLGQEEAEELVARPDSGLAISAYNDPGLTVVSGRAPALSSLESELSQREVFCRRLPVNYAFHHPSLTPLEPLLVEALEGIAPQAPLLSVVSTVTGQPISDGQGDFATAAYWGRNLLCPVRFRQAIEALAGKGPTDFLEIGPHPVLGTSIANCLAASESRGAVLASIRRDESERQSVLGALGCLYCSGRDVRWEALEAAPDRTSTAPVAEPLRTPTTAPSPELAKPAPPKSEGGAAASVGAATSPAQQTATAILAEACKVAPEEIDPSASVLSYGADSLALAQAANKLSSALGFDVPLFEILAKEPTIGAVLAYVAETRQGA